MLPPWGVGVQAPKQAGSDGVVNTAMRVSQGAADGGRFCGAECLNLERCDVASVQVAWGVPFAGNETPRDAVGDGGRFDWGVAGTQRNLQKKDSSISSSLETQPAKRRVGQGSGSE